MCPITELNGEYLATQRDAFLRGGPGPDFGNGDGESAHVGRPTEADVKGDDARQAMGLEKLVVDAKGQGEKEVVEKVNGILGF